MPVIYYGSYFQVPQNLGWRKIKIKVDNYDKVLLEHIERLYLILPFRIQSTFPRWQLRKRRIHQGMEYGQEENIGKSSL